MPDTERAEYERRQQLSIQPPPPSIKRLLLMAEQKAQAGDYAGAQSAAAQMSDAAWRDGAFAFIAKRQALRDAPGARSAARRIGDALTRLETLTQIATSLMTSAAMGASEPGYMMAVPAQIQAYENARRPPATMTPAQVAKLRLEARLTLAEAKSLLPRIHAPELKQIAFRKLADAFALARNVADAKRMIAAIARPADRLYPLCVLANEMLESGDVSGAKAVALQAQVIAAPVREPTNPTYERRILFKVFFYTGESFRAYQVAKSLHEPYDVADSLLMLAAQLAQAGGKPEAKRLIAEARAQFPHIGDSVAKDTAHEYLVYALIVLPDFAEASRVAATIFDPTRRQRAEKAIADAKRRT